MCNTLPFSLYRCTVFSIVTYGFLRFSTVFWKFSQTRVWRYWRTALVVTAHEWMVPYMRNINMTLLKRILKEHVLSVTGSARVRRRYPPNPGLTEHVQFLFLQYFLQVSNRIFTCRNKSFTVSVIGSLVNTAFLLRFRKSLNALSRTMCSLSKQNQRTNLQLDKIFSSFTQVPSILK